MTQQLQSSVAFLPVNPNLSPLRNQGRQKLARLNSEDFAQLVVHILLDTKRRQQLSIQTGELMCVYDSVHMYVEYVSWVLIVKVCELIPMDKFT